MEIYAKGQLSYLILNCLLERDYYGLDIISEIKDRSNGRILLKKPSVYSNLTRMEKQGQVSSYVQSSELGPNRKYYSITEKGRDTFASLKEYFDRNGIDVFRDFFEEGAMESPIQPVQEKPFMFKVEIESEEEKTQEVEQDDFFDFSSLEEQPKQEEVVDDGKFLEKVEIKEENQEPKQIFSIANLLKQEEKKQEVLEKEEIALKQEEVEEVQSVIEQPTPQPQVNLVEDQTIFASTQLSNQQIYDISKDINKYKRKRSFAEDQMAFAVSDPLARDDEKTRQNIEELKSSILANKGKTDQRMSQDEFYRVKPEKPVQQTSASVRNFYATLPTSNPEPVKQESPLSDDGVFISGQAYDASQVAKARKIEPPRLKIMGEKENPLPAPKRDNSVDLSHKEIISKLYSKSKGGNGEGQVDDNYIYDYDDLQDYYHTQGIAFKVYEKKTVIEKHNTNKLGFIASAICFGLAILSTIGIFIALYLTANIMKATAFLYLAFPIAFGVEFGVRLFYYKKHTSWEPKPMLPSWLVCLIAVFGLGAIVGLNFAFGLTPENWLTFSTTLFLPAVYILIYLPVYNFIKKSLIIKHWR